MSVEIIRAEGGPDERNEWNRCVARSTQAGPFHRYEALVLLAKHAGATLHPLIGYDEHEPIGVLPFFERSRGSVVTLRSPAAIVESMPLGPAFVDRQRTKRPEVERSQQQFIRGSLERAIGDSGADFVHVRTDWHHTDVRPLVREGFDATPFYTYIVDLGPSKKAVLQEFSRDARSNIRNTDEAAYDIREEGKAALERIVEQVQARFAEQRKDLALTSAFVTDLYEQLPDGAVRPYVCYVDGEYASGVIVLEHGGTSYRWQGGVKTDVRLPVSDLLDWHIMCDSMDRAVERYDLVGANVARLCRYKSKFGPSAERYYNLELTSRKMRVAQFGLRTARRVRSSVLSRADMR